MTQLLCIAIGAAVAALPAWLWVLDARRDRDLAMKRAALADKRAEVLESWAAFGLARSRFFELLATGGGARETRASAKGYDA